MRNLTARHWIAIGTLAVTSTGCSSGTSQPPGQPLQSDQPRATPQPVTNTDVVEAASDNAAFSFSLYQQLRTTHPGSNLFYSPWSISSALAMTYAGAANNTAAQMSTTLHFTLPSAQLHAAFNSLAQSLTARMVHPTHGSPIVMRNANQLFSQTGHVFLPTFLDVLTQDYGASVSLLDFRVQSEASRLSINQWVSVATDDHIADLLGPGTITADTQFVLVNASYFNAPWFNTFDPSLTRSASFHRLDGTDVSAPSMSHTSDVRSAGAEGWQAVEIPYANEDTTMLVVVPTAGTYEAYESSLTASTIADVVTRLSSRTVALTIPKFSMHSSFDLATALTTMGMPDAFDVAADFSAMDGTTALRINDVVHQAWIDVAESGTQAAAATAVTGVRASIVVEPTTITIDRPFLFFIRDTTTGTILFAGRVLDPTAH